MESSPVRHPISFHHVTMHDGGLRYNNPDRCQHNRASLLVNGLAGRTSLAITPIPQNADASLEVHITLEDENPLAYRPFSERSHPPVLTLPLCKVSDLSDKDVRDCASWIRRGMGDIRRLRVSHILEDHRIVVLPECFGPSIGFIMGLRQKGRLGEEPFFIQA